MEQTQVYFKKALPFIIIFGVVTGIAAGLFAVQKAAVYAVVQSYDLDLVNRPVTSDYQYGEYYDLKGAELYTQYVMSLLRSPAVIESIYQSAGMSVHIDNVSQFTNQFKTVEDASQRFTVTFDRYTKSEAEHIVTGMNTVLAEKVAAGAKDNAGNSLFTLRPYNAVITYQTTNVWLYAGVGTVAGWLLAIVVVYLRRYLKM